MKWVIIGTVCYGPICHDGLPYDDRFVTFRQCRAALAYYVKHPDRSIRRGRHVWQRDDRCEEVED
jgi:hypothetical protein